jgi:hypothetical protein
MRKHETMTTRNDILDAANEPMLWTLFQPIDDNGTPLPLERDARFERHWYAGLLKQMVRGLPHLLAFTLVALGTWCFLSLS